MSGPENLRITIAISLFHPIVGGAESQMLALALRWVQMGHRVRVLTRSIPQMGSQETVHGIHIDRCIRTLNAGPMFGLTFLWSLYRALSRYSRADHVVMAAQGVWEAVAVGRFAQKNPRQLTLARLAGTGKYGELSLLKNARGSHMWRKSFLNNRGFLALSSDARQELIEFGAHKNAIHSITNGVEYGRFFREVDDRRPQTVLYVGRLAREKNPRALLEAWGLVNRPDWNLKIVGTGPMYDEMVSLASMHSLPNVEFAGHQANVVAALHSASIFVLPSFGEGCCNALLEAMAAGLCPIASDVSGNRQLISHDQDGWLVKVSDAPAMARAIQRAIDNPDIRQRLAVHAQQRANLLHDMDKVAARYIELFKRLCKDP